MGIIALDLSKRSTGWALWMPNMEKPVYGVWELGSAHTENGRVYRKLLQNLAELRMLHRFEALFYEDPLSATVLSGSTNIETLKVLGGLAEFAEYFGYCSGLQEYKGVNQRRWRKFFIGTMPNTTKSKQWKDYARERCAQYGWFVKKNDESDALGLLDYGCELRRIIPPWRKDEVLRPILGGAK